jgi:hypothetical protein
MRTAFTLLILLSCTNCALSQKQVAEMPAPAQPMVGNRAAAADVSPRFECSDGSISASQSDCLVDMARARLPSEWNDPSTVGSFPSHTQH